MGTLGAETCQGPPEVASPPGECIGAEHVDLSIDRQLELGGIRPGTDPRFFVHVGTPSDELAEHPFHRDLGGLARPPAPSAEQRAGGSRELTDTNFAADDASLGAPRVADANERDASARELDDRRRTWTRTVVDGVLVLEAQRHGALGARRCAMRLRGGARRRLRPAGRQHENGEDQRTHERERSSVSTPVFETTRVTPALVTPLAEREKHALAIASSIPLAGQLVFHLWEEWSVFSGRRAFVDRHGETSTTLATLAELLLFVLPLALWAVLLVRALTKRAPIPGEARPGDGVVARALGSVIRVVSPIAATFVVVHAGMLWGARVLFGEAPLRAYDLLQITMGRPAYLVFYGVGIPAVLWHLAATLPDGLEGLGIVGESGRRQAHVVTAVLGLCLFVLYAQLAGWLATGTGTFWAIDVVTD